jgi:hypothetical protein
VTVTGYDEVSPFAGVITGTTFRQKAYTLRNRVSWSRYIEGMLADTTFKTATPPTIPTTTGSSLYNQKP